MTAMRNPDAKHTDFTDLIGVIPSNPKLLPSNLDMVIERFGHFLIGEWKRPNEKISMGQEILLKRLATKDDIVVLLIEGDTDDGMVVNKIFNTILSKCFLQLRYSVCLLAKHCCSFFNRIILNQNKDFIAFIS